MQGLAAWLELTTVGRIVRGFASGITALTVGICGNLIATGFPTQGWRGLPSDGAVWLAVGLVFCYVAFEVTLYRSTTFERYYADLGGNLSSAMAAKLKAGDTTGFTEMHHIMETLRKSAETSRG